MSDLIFIPPVQAKTSISFEVDEPRNFMGSLCLLNESLGGVADRIDSIAKALSPDRKESNRIVCESGASQLLENRAWNSYEAWFEYVSHRDAETMLRAVVERIFDKLAKCSDEDPGEIDRLLADKEFYLSVVEQCMREKGMDFDREQVAAVHDVMRNAEEYKALVIEHLGYMWRHYFEEEWRQALPVVKASVEAFVSLSFEGRSFEESIRHVIGRDSVPDSLVQEMEEKERVIFLPSPHIGPYLLMIGSDERTSRVLLGARIPKGAHVDGAGGDAGSSSLSRSELLTRLEALSDDARLRMLKLIAVEGPKTTQEAMESLGLSQSSASRHLIQLTATGYLINRPGERAKMYEFNPIRLEDTFRELKSFLD